MIEPNKGGGVGACRRAAPRRQRHKKRAIPTAAGKRHTVESLLYLEHHVRNRHPVCLLRACVARERGGALVSAASIPGCKWASCPPLLCEQPGTPRALDQRSACEGRRLCASTRDRIPSPSSTPPWCDGRTVSKVCTNLHQSCGELERKIDVPDPTSR